MCFDQLIVHASSPTFCNIKPGNMFIRMKKNTGFPHEVGVILGYPVEDVIEFEKHGGQGCKYCGCWKSYCDVEKAKKCQCKYKACISMCDRMYEQGYSLKQIIEEYGKCADVA